MVVSGNDVKVAVKHETFTVCMLMCKASNKLLLYLSTHENQLYNHNFLFILNTISMSQSVNCMYSIHNIQAGILLIL